REGRSSIPSHPLADLGGRGWVEGKNVRPRPTLPGDCTARGASECRIWVNLAIFTMSAGSPLYTQYSPGDGTSRVASCAGPRPLGDGQVVYETDVPRPPWGRNGRQGCLRRITIPQATDRLQNRR